MARGTGARRGPRQPFQRQPNPGSVRQVQPTPPQQQQQQQQPPQQIIQIQQAPPQQQQQQQQYQQQQMMQPGSQPIQMPGQQWYTTVPQQIQMPPRLQHPQATMRHRQLQYIPPQAQQQMQQQQPQQQQPQQQIQLQQQHPQVIQQQQQQQQQQLQQPQQQTTNRIMPQTIHIGNKRHAQEPSVILVQEQNNYILSEQILREPLISALERNINKQLISHTLHRTFGIARIF